MIVSLVDLCFLTAGGDSGSSSSADACSRDESFSGSEWYLFLLFGDTRPESVSICSACVTTVVTGEVRIGVGAIKLVS